MPKYGLKSALSIVVARSTSWSVLCAMSPYQHAQIGEAGHTAKLPHPGPSILATLRSRTRTGRMNAPMPYLEIVSV